MFGTKISYPWTLCTPFMAAPKPADAMARDGFLDLLAVEKKGHLGSEIRPLGSDRSKVGPPSDVRWFINPMKTIVIGTINHSYWRYKPTERYRLGAPLCTKLLTPNWPCGSVASLDLLARAQRRQHCPEPRETTQPRKHQPMVNRCQSIR